MAAGRTERQQTRNEPPMTSNQPNADQLQFLFADENPESEPEKLAQNIQPDDSTLAAIEKSALGNDQFENSLMEEIVDETNMEIAWARIKANRGAAGPDGITVEDFPEWLRPRWKEIRWQLLDGTYQPPASVHPQTRWRRETPRHSKPGGSRYSTSHRVNPDADLRSGLFRIEFRLSTFPLGSRCSQASPENHSQRSPSLRRYGSFKVL